MEMRIECPGCKTRFLVKAEMAGCNVECKFCERKFRVPYRARVTVLDEKDVLTEEKVRDIPLVSDTARPDTSPAPVIVSPLLPLPEAASTVWIPLGAIVVFYASALLFAIPLAIDGRSVAAGLGMLSLGLVIHSLLLIPLTAKTLKNASATFDFNVPKSPLLQAAAICSPIIAGAAMAISVGDWSFPTLAWGIIVGSAISLLLIVLTLQTTAAKSVQAWSWFLAIFVSGAGTATLALFLGVTFALPLWQPYLSAQAESGTPAPNIAAVPVPVAEIPVKSEAPIQLEEIARTPESQATQPVAGTKFDDDGDDGSPGANEPPVTRDRPVATLAQETSVALAGRAADYERIVQMDAVVHYICNGKEVDVVRDLSPRGNDAKAVGSTVKRLGPSKNAFNFGRDDGHDHLFVGDRVDGFPLGDFTISVFFWSENDGVLIGSGQNELWHREWFLSPTEFAWTWVAGHRSGAVGRTGTKMLLSTQPRAWQHVCITRKEGVVSGYVNGKLQSTSRHFPAEQLPVYSHGLMIGNVKGDAKGRLGSTPTDFTSWKPYEGMVERVVILPRALSAGEIFALERACRSSDGLNDQNQAKMTITNSIGMTLACIPAGEFVMGSPESEANRHAGEVQHTVRISRPFAIGLHEVTQGQWRTVMGSNPSRFRESEDLPIETVTWYDAVEFCRKLTQKEGRTYRLPTEAEWEYACRAGTTTPYAGNTLEQMGWNGRDAGLKSHPVGKKTPNAWGLFDMHGNVREWCSDWHGDYRGDETDPQGPPTGLAKIVRGGSWYNTALNCRSAYHHGYIPNARYDHCGFRVVMEIPTRLPSIEAPAGKRITVAGRAERGYVMGPVSRGTTITLQYVSGTWKAWGRYATENPDALRQEQGDRCRLVIAEGSGKGSSKVLVVVPAETAQRPFRWTADKDYADVILRMNDDAGDWQSHPEGNVTYDQVMSAATQAPSHFRPLP